MEKIKKKNEKPDRDSLSIVVSNKGKLSFTFALDTVINSKECV